MRGSSVEPGLPNTWVTPSVRRTSKRASRPVRGMGATVALGRRDRPRRGHRAGITARAGAARYHRPPLGTLLGLLVVVALIGANAAFTAGEYAFVAADRSRIAVAAEGGSRRARVLQGMLHRLAFYLSGTQLGITITSIVLGFLIEPLVSHALEPAVEKVGGESAAKGVSVVLGLILATVVQLVAAELIPKNVAVARPERTALRLAVPMRGYASVFAPLINLLNRSANAIVRLFGVEPVQELESIRSLDELEFVIRSSGQEGTINEEATR